MKKILSVLAALACSTAAANACSVGRSYDVPTGFELVQLSNAIVLAEIEGELPLGDREEGHRLLDAHILEVIKGPPTLKANFSGTVAEVDPSDPYNIIQAHPNSFAGSCTRYSYSVGSKVIFFLRQDAETGEFWPLGMPFARVSEDIRTNEDPWYIAVKKYVELQDNLDPMEQLDALEQWRKELLAAPVSLTNKALVEDITVHFMSRSSYKPTAYLIESFKTLSSGAPLRYELAVEEGHPEGETIEAVMPLLANVPKPDPSNIDDLRAGILFSLVHGDHPEALPFFQDLAATPLPAALQAPVVEYLTKHNDIERAIDLFIDTAVTTLAVGNDYSRNRTLGAWTNSMMGVQGVRLSELQAEKIYGFYMYLHRTGLAWKPDLLLPVLDLLRPADYSQSLELALALARAGDKKVIQWAKGKIGAEYDWDTDKVPVQILVHSAEDEDDPILLPFSCSTSVRRQIAIGALAESGLDDAQDILHAVARMGDLDEGDRNELVDALMLIQGKAAVASTIQDRGFWGFSDNEDRRELIGYIQSGSKPPKPEYNYSYEDIDCSGLEGNPLYVQ